MIVGPIPAQMDDFCDLHGTPDTPVSRIVTVKLPTPPNSEIICGQNVSTKVVCGILLFFEKKAMLKI